MSSLGNVSSITLLRFTYVKHNNIKVDVCTLYVYVTILKKHGQNIFTYESQRAIHHLIKTIL